MRGVLAGDCQRKHARSTWREAAQAPSTSNSVWSDSVPRRNRVEILQCTRRGPIAQR
jgi:hypothetical protein